MSRLSAILRVQILKPSLLQMQQQTVAAKEGQIRLFQFAKRGFGALRLV